MGLKAVLFMGFLLLSGSLRGGYFQGGYLEEQSPKEEYYQSEIGGAGFEQDNWKKAIQGIDYSGEKPGEEQKKSKTDTTAVDVDEEEDTRSYEEINVPDQTMNEFWSLIFKIILIGVAVIGASMAFLLLGQLTSIYVLQHFAMVITIAGLVIAFGGLSLESTT